MNDQPMIMPQQAPQQALMQTRGQHAASLQAMKPRSLATAMSNLNAEAALACDEFYYGWGQGDNKIEGASIKLANAAARCYGNCTIELMPVQETGDAWIFTAVFLDLETGFSLPRQFRMAKNFPVYGKHDEHRKMDIRFQIGQSKCIRNLILNAMPIGIINAAMDAAKSQLGKKMDDWIATLEKNGKGTGMVQARDIVLKALAKQGATEARVLAKLEIAKREAIDRDRLVLLHANLKALERGETTAAEIFPDPAADGGDSKNAAALDKLKTKMAEGEVKTGDEAEPGDILDEWIKMYGDAGGVLEEFAERHSTTTAAIRGSKNGERRELADKIKVETNELISQAAEAAKKKSPKSKDGSLPGMDKTDGSEAIKK